jgi:hypothetical protein
MGNQWFKATRPMRVIWIVIIAVAGIMLGMLLGRVFSSASATSSGAVVLTQSDRATWLIMAADSYSQDGDVELTRKRLARLVGGAVSWKQLAVATEQIAVDRQNQGDQRGAQRLRLMATALNLPNLSAPDAAAETSRGIEVWRILLFIGAVLAFLALVAIGLWYMAQRSLKRQDAVAVTEPARDEVDFEPSESGEVTDQGTPASDQAPSHALNAYPPSQAHESHGFQPLEDADAEPSRIFPTPVFKSAPIDIIDSTPSVREKQVSPLVTSANDSTGILGRYEADYTFGTDDFDCSFTISTSGGDFLGDCGIGVADVLPAIGPQHVDALEVWLFDKGDVSSMSKILVSEYAYENPSLNTRLSAKGELLLAEPGALIVLETRTLRITAQVSMVEYDTSVDPNKSYFRRLAIEIVAEPADD